MAAADAHRHADHSELRVTETEGHGPERPLGAALDVAVTPHQVLAVCGDGDLGAAVAVELRLEDVAADIAPDREDRTDVL
jgi:hypothetical protein